MDPVDENVRKRGVRRDSLRILSKWYDCGEYGLELLGTRWAQAAQTII
jgi:hypothetical protein